MPFLVSLAPCFQRESKRKAHTLGGPTQTAPTQTRHGWRISSAAVPEEHEQREEDPVVHGRHRVRNVDHSSHPGKTCLRLPIYMLEFAAAVFPHFDRQYVLSGSSRQCGCGDGTRARTENS